MKEVRIMVTVIDTEPRFNPNLTHQPKEEVFVTNYPPITDEKTLEAVLEGIDISVSPFLMKHKPDELHVPGVIDRQYPLPYLSGAADSIQPYQGEDIIVRKAQQPGATECSSYAVAPELTQAIIDESVASVEALRVEECESVVIPEPKPTFCTYSIKRSSGVKRRL